MGFSRKHIKLTGALCCALAALAALREVRAPDLIKTLGTEIDKFSGPRTETQPMPPFRPDDDESDGDFEWTPYAELHLINSLAGLKAVGINYHWCLAVVYNKFTSAMGVDISLDELEKHLGTFYDFKAAAKRPGNAATFPNAHSEFALPPDEFPGVEARRRTTAVSSGAAASPAVVKTMAKTSSTPTPASKAITSETKPEEKPTASKKKSGPVASPVEKNKQVAPSKKLRKKPATPQPPPKRLRR